MRIVDFQKLIQEIPCKNQSFDIKKANWKIDAQQKFIDNIFNGKEVITINRQDLINSMWNTQEFIIKTLMWGYPTKGRGRNIENMLDPKNLEQLVRILDNYKDQDISIDQLIKDIKSISGLGLSTMTKFTHFLNTTIEGNKAVILDIQIIEAINAKRFSDFNHLSGIKYENAAKRYPEYLKTINDLSLQINADPDQIEMFLFTFGRTLSPRESTLRDRMNSGGGGMTVLNKPRVENIENVKRKPENDLYRERLIGAYKTLISIRVELFTSALNIAMAGELQEIDRVFEEGEVYNFEIEHLKSTNDINLTKLIEFHEQLDNLMNSIANINTIKESELE